MPGQVTKPQGASASSCEMELQALPLRRPRGFNTVPMLVLYRFLTSSPKGLGQTPQKAAIFRNRNESSPGPWCCQPPPRLLPRGAAGRVTVTQIPRGHRALQPHPQATTQTGRSPPGAEPPRAPTWEPRRLPAALCPAHGRGGRAMTGQVGTGARTGRPLPPARTPEPRAAGLSGLVRPARGFHGEACGRE